MEKWFAFLRIQSEWNAFGYGYTALMPNSCFLRFHYDGTLSGWDNETVGSFSAFVLEVLSDLAKVIRTVLQQFLGQPQLSYGSNH